MTNLPGSRPVVTLYLDPAEVLRPDGALWSFWSKFVVSFTRTFTEHRYAVVLDISDHPDPSTAIDAQSYVVAGTRAERDVHASDVAFGQLLVAPDVHPAYAQSVTFEHDYSGIAQDIIGALPDVDEVLVVPRPGEHAYVDRITAELQDRISTRVASVDELVSVPATTAVVSFRGAPEVVRETIETLSPSVPLVVQGEPFSVDREITFLDLLGTQCGALIAGAVADTLAGESREKVRLPHQLLTQ